MPQAAERCLRLPKGARTCGDAWGRVEMLASTAGDSMTIPFFDGHNDTLLRLIDDARPNKVELFTQGMAEAHIDLPRAKAAGMVGGFFAMFPPPLKTSLGAVAAAPTTSGGQLPPQRDIAEAPRTTNGPAAL